MDEICCFYFIAFIFISISLGTSQREEFSAEKICSLIANGTIIKDPRACNKWIQCIDNKTISGQCPTGFYDKNTEGCLQEDDIECISSNPCAPLGNGNGFTVNPYSCNDYYYCNNGTPSLGHCPLGMHFNGKTCARNFDCKLPIDPNSLCNIVPDGVFIQGNSTTSCSSYQICSKGGQLKSGSCPDGFSFNAFKGICDYPENVSCGKIEKQSIPSNGQCRLAGEFVSDNRTCSGYYFCQKGRNDLDLVWGECTFGRFFNSAMPGGSCVDRTQISCSYDRCVGIKAKGIRLVNASNDNCKGYKVCQDGVQIGSGICPNDMFYDETIQRCTDKIVSFPACRNVE